MANSTRNKLLDKLAQIENHLAATELGLLEMYNAYNPDYPEHAAVIIEAEKAVSRLTEMLRTFRDIM